MENKFTRRTEIMCPNCMVKKLMESNAMGIYEIWCDECGTSFEKTGSSSVKYK